MTATVGYTQGPSGFFFKTADGSGPYAMDSAGNMYLPSGITGGFSVALSVTRPANTPTYSAGDVVGAAAAALTFPLAGPSAGGIIITTASLEIDLAAVPAGMTSFRLHLYSVTPPSALADDAAWDLPAGDRASYLGYVDLGTPVDLGSTLFVQTTGINKHLKLAGTSLFGYLVTTAGFTAAASTVHVVTLNAVAV